MTAKTAHGSSRPPSRPWASAATGAPSRPARRSASSPTRSALFAQAAEDVQSCGGKHARENVAELCVGVRGHGRQLTGRDSENLPAEKERHDRENEHDDQRHIARRNACDGRDLDRLSLYANRFGQGIQRASTSSTTAGPCSWARLPVYARHLPRRV